MFCCLSRSLITSGCFQVLDDTGKGKTTIERIAWVSKHQQLAPAVHVKRRSLSARPPMHTPLRTPEMLSACAPLISPQ